MNKDFCIFILTHGRPDNVITLKALKNSGCTYPVYLIIDNEDKTADQYYKIYGKSNVIMFDKIKYANECDECNNFDERRTITMARNACFDIAKELGYKYFVELDDDYIEFEYRYIRHEKLMDKPIRDFNRLIDSFLKAYKTIDCLSVALAQGGDFIGGASNKTVRNGIFKRKAMNSFICSTERPFKFIGAMNEDVNTYTTLGSRGKLFFTIPMATLKQKQTQSQSGGITDMYLKYSTYCKAFTTVMNMPSSVKVSMVGTTQPRIHHAISWRNTVPKILNEKYKK